MTDKSGKTVTPESKQEPFDWCRMYRPMTPVLKVVVQTLEERDAEIAAFKKQLEQKEPDPCQ